MAVGLPLKTTYADGDVFSASDINDTNGTVNLFTSSTLSMASGKNAIINGGMEIWQRGTSFTVASGSTTTYAADRWLATRGATGLTVTRQTVSDSTNLPTIRYALRCQRDSGNTSTIDYAIRQSVETANAIPYAGKTVTLSWYARAGANYSATSSLLNYQLQTGTGTDQNNAGGYTGSVNALNSTITLTTTWQRFTASATLASTATEFAVIYYSNPTGTAGANDWFEVTGVQVELGSATTFSRAGGTIQGELAACQRYFYRVSATSPTGIATYYSTTQVFTNITLPTTMRIAPTSITSVSSPQFTIYVAGSGRSSSAIAFNQAFANVVELNVTSASDTAGRSGSAILTTGAIEISAEL
jgi:hypothetical protein